MSKFNLFTLFLTVIIVVIVGELLVNDYVDYPDLKEQIASNVLGDGSAAAGVSGTGEDPDLNLEP
ncbi:MAG TPA: hypothetical protein VI588_01470, partial [Candidatus Gracilibacteria bacterium]|nr:hypothetical protein [Candidatus Gracilibacteria bacterium]